MDYETPQDLFDALAAPFPTDFISWRIGSTNQDKSKGLALAYVDARAVMDRLDSICGMDCWQCNYSVTGNGSVVCNLGIRMPSGEWIWKADGAGHTDVEGEKGMLSDALKRAAVRFGVARYLYDLDSPWVALENKRIPDAELKRLAEVHEKAAAKIGWGERAGVQAYRLLLRIVEDTVLQPSDVQPFLDKHKGMIPLLPVAMRRHLNEQLARIGGKAQEAA
jgi:hypothetical protein